MKKEKRNKIRAYIKNRDLIKPSIIMENFDLGYTESMNIINILEKEKLIYGPNKKGEGRIIKMSYNEFIAGLENNDFVVSIDSQSAIQSIDSGYFGKGEQYNLYFGTWLSLLSFVIAPISLFGIKGYGSILILILGILSGKAIKTSTQEKILEVAVKNEEFYNLLLKTNVLKIHK